MQYSRIVAGLTLYEGGIRKFAEDSAYAPRGCVSFLSIHQAKDMTFPVVLADSLNNVPRDHANDVMKKVAEKYQHQKLSVPYGKMKYFDDPSFDPSAFHFRPIRDMNIRKSQLLSLKQDSFTAVHE